MADSEQSNGADTSISQELEDISNDQEAVVQRIAALEQQADRAVTYPVERVRGSVGRWLIPRRNTLEEHLALVKDKERDIDFSPANYPAFDAKFTEKYAGTGFFEPLHDNFPKYTGLRNNLATVRNYMLQLYFPDNSPDDQLRIQHLGQIAEYLAEGLSNDRAFFGLLPVHNPFKPFIDVNMASAPDGEGARYLYQKILEMQRHSNWTRPFSALTSMFGGAAYGQWDLPSLQDSAFAHDAADDEPNPRNIGAEIATLATTYDVLENKRESLVTRQHQSSAASDLDTIGNQLLFSYYQMRDAVEDLSAPIRREAIDIAHEILRRLSVKLGATSVSNGISFKPTDDNAALGSSSGVGRILVRMAGMMRALGDDMMSNPIIAGAHEAMGQLAYLAKLEALHMANAAGDTKLASSIRGQLSQLRAFGQGLEGKSFGDLLDKMKDGVALMEQKLRAAGLVADGQAVDAATVGRGSGSQAQALNQARLQQDKQHYTSQTKQQQGLNQAQQGQAAQTAAQTQAAIAQMQAAQRAAAPAGQAPSVFATPTATVKKAPNGAAAIKNASRVAKTARAEMAKAAVTAPPPQPIASPPMQFGVDPKVLAGLGTQLQQAQSAAGALTSSAVGPRNASDAIRKAQSTKAAQDAQQQQSVELHEQQLHGPKPGGRSR